MSRQQWHLKSEDKPSADGASARGLHGWAHAGRLRFSGEVAHGVNEAVPTPLRGQARPVQASAEPSRNWYTMSAAGTGRRRSGPMPTSPAMTGRAAEEDTKTMGSTASVEAVLAVFAVVGQRDDAALGPGLPARRRLPLAAAAAMRRHSP